MRKLALLVLVLTATAGYARASADPPIPGPGDGAKDSRWISPLTQPLIMKGPYTRFAKLKNGNILTVRDNRAYVSADLGQSWESRGAVAVAVQ